MFGEDDPHIGSNYQNLAGVYKAQGESEKAEKLYKKSLRKKLMNKLFCCKEAV